MRNDNSPPTAIPSAEPSVHSCLLVCLEATCRSVGQYRRRWLARAAGRYIQEIELRVGRWLQGVIPTGMSIVLFDWKEKSGGEDFHDRFLLTDKGGMTIGAGFSADGPHQNAQIGLLDPKVWSVKLRALNRSATVYELADRVLVVHGDGRVEPILVPSLPSHLTNRLIWADEGNRATVPLARNKRNDY